MIRLALATGTEQMLPAQQTVHLSRHFAKPQHNAGFFPTVYQPDANRHRPLSGIAVLFEQLGVLFQCEKMRLCTVGLLHLLDDELAEPFELKELLFAGGGAYVAYDFLSDLIAVAHRLYDLQDIAVCEFFSAHEHGDIYRTKPGWKCINIQSCSTTLPRLGNRG